MLLQVTHDEPIQHREDRHLAPRGMKSAPGELVRGQCSDAPVVALGAGLDPLEQLAQREAAVALDHAQPQRILRGSSERSGLGRSVEDPLHLAEPEREELGEVGQGLARPPGGLRLGPEPLGQGPWFAGLDRRAETADRPRRRLQSIRRGPRIVARCFARALGGRRIEVVGHAIAASLVISRPVAWPGRIARLLPLTRTRALPYWSHFDGRASHAHRPFRSRSDPRTGGCPMTRTLQPSQGAANQSGAVINKDAYAQAQDFLPLNGLDHVEFWVGNARQASAYYRALWGFTPVAFAGLETGGRDRASYVMRQNDFTLVSTAPLTPDGEIAEHVRRHGDGVHDIAFAVDDVASSWRETTARGARSALEPTDFPGEKGVLRRSAIHTYGEG